MILKNTIPPTDRPTAAAMSVAIIGFGAGFASEFYINKSFFAFMIFSMAAILLCSIVQLVHALLGGGTELLPGLLTALLQTVLSIPPVMLLYLPFKEGGAMNHSY